MPRDMIEYSQPIGDQVAYTTCYMCACRCGIKVHLKDGRCAISRATATIRSIAACSAARARPGS